MVTSHDMMASHDAYRGILVKVSANKVFDDKATGIFNQGWIQHDLLGRGVLPALVGGRVLIKYLSCVSLSHVCHLPFQNTGVILMINA